MPRITESTDQEKTPKASKKSIQAKETEEGEIVKLNRMLGAVMKYISADEIQEIDIEYLLDHTDGLRQWWNQYRELDRKRIEEEIKKSLSGLSLEELERIHEQIQER